MIATKIRDGDYKDINNVEEDLNRMCRNAQMFNEPGSQIYKVIVICIQKRRALKKTLFVNAVRCI